MNYWKVGKTVAVSLAWCILWNTLFLGSYHWYKAAKDWKIESWTVAPTPTPTPKKIDLGHEPAELAMDMEYDSLKQMEKAIKEELKYRDGKK